MLNVVWVKLKDYQNSLPMMLVMTGLALLLIYVFGRSFEGVDLASVAIVDEDASAVSARYMEGLSSIEGYQFNVVAYEEGFSGSSDGSYIALVVIEEGFERSYLEGAATLTMYKSGESIEHFTLEAALQAYGQRFVVDESFVEGLPVRLSSLGLTAESDVLRDNLAIQVAKYPIMTIKTSTYSGMNSTGYDSLKHSFIGFILFFSMFTMVFGIGSIVEEKEHMVWQRQSVAPVSTTKVMLGNMIASFLVGMVQLLLMVIISRLIFGLDWGGSLLALLLVLAAFVIAVTSLGLFLSRLVHTMQQLGSFSPIVIVSSSMIGGCMWPLEIISSRVLLFLADLTPQRWAYKGLKAVIVNNGGLVDVTGALGMLLLLALVFFTLGTLPYKGLWARLTVEVD